MELQELVSHEFEQSAATLQLSLDAVSPPLIAAARLASTVFLQGNKLLCAGVGNGAVLAQLLTTHLAAVHEHDRPGLPAINISLDAFTASAVASNEGAEAVLARQLRALGSRGDLLFLIDSAGEQASLLQAVTAAHEAELSVVVLSGHSDGKLLSKLAAEDIALVITTAARPAQAQTAATLIIGCFCLLIDTLLFGEH